MNYTRLLKRGMSGADVRYMKDALFALRFYTANITKITNDKFGSDTLSAVLRFQEQYRLTRDGIIGPKTWAAVEAALADAPINPPATPPATESTSSDKALELAAYARSRLGDVYAWAACNLYPITEAWIKNHDKTAANAQRSINDWKKKLGWGMTDLRAFDCSGLPSACLMAQGILRARKDCDGLWDMCRQITVGELLPGDLCFRVSASNYNDETHVGVYVGGGRVVHAKGRDVGVVIEGLYQNGAKWWAKFGRLKAYE